MEPRSREEETGVHCRTSATYSLRARRGRLVPAALLALGLGDAMPLGHPVAILTWYVVGLGAAVWLQEALAKKRKPWHDNA